MHLAPGNRVMVRLLGPFSFEINGGQINRWRAGRARALFQYLLVNRGQFVHRDRLHEVLWPDNESHSSGSLKVAAHAVRRILEAQGGDDPKAVELIYRDGGYGLQAADLWLDVDEFQRSFDRGRTASLAKDHTRTVEHFRRAMQLYAGDFLAGETDEWITEQRTWTRGLALCALTELRVDALVREDWPDVLNWCRRTLELEPCHEETYQTLMMMHGELGELARVRDWYELCRRRLWSILELEPSDRTERVLSSALNHHRNASSGAVQLPRKTPALRADIAQAR